MDVAEQGDSYMIQDSLISGGNDLLPVNTRIFSSTVRYGRLFYFIGLGSICLFFFLLIIGGALNSSVGSIIIGLAFALL